MTMVDYSGKKALIIGMARSGLAAARLLDRLGAKLAITDMKSESELADIIEKLPKDAGRFFGGHDGVSLDDYDLAVISPGVPYDAPFTKAVRKAGIELISEVELAFTLLDCPVIAVTGANGKSTTVSLIGAILKSAGFNVYVGGNIGAPLAEAVGGDYDWIVAEISSFQLETVKTFRPKIGLLLNITPDHLDRHKDMETYTALKTRLFQNQGEGDVLILNADDERVVAIEPRPGSQALYFSEKPLTGAGAWLNDDRAVARMEDEVFELFRAGQLTIKGRHNTQNAMAASLAALAVGAQPEIIRAAVIKFPGLPHRMELVDEIGGIKYYNDSKSTNVDATVKSLSGFNKNVALIAGGADKGSGFGGLADAVVENAKGVALIGETAQVIFKELGEFEPKVIAKGMEEAVRLASGWLKPGGSVLLSPGCASFDMYKNFEDRGDSFKAEVAGLKEEGQRCR
ncbi:UDP-N-acetylmuramoylalanine--D-glutamate ligase [hydrothermal vent metagenome]|uniref:UDP-N-acetylmuramoylalanine--D-glutamate ligase n=1 Tax=hydrothermal vent metagenome TaxID=652676 RepID=A0A3B1C5W7_9ZZZZ